MKAVASFTKNMFIGAKRHEFSVTILTKDDGTTAPIGDIRRWAVDSRGEGVDIAERAGIQITEWEN